MEKEDIVFLSQLIKSLEDSEKKLEKAYEKKDSDEFNKSKKIMINIQGEISKLTK